MIMTRSIVTSAVLTGMAVLANISAAVFDHDGWEFYGGQKKKLKHGLNRATADAAPRDNDSVRFDKKNSETKPELLVTNDEAPPATTASPALRISSDRVKSKEELLLLPDRYSVLNFDPKHEDEDSPWWGRLYINGFPNSIQYFRAEFGYPPPDRVVKLVLASPLNMCDEVSGLPVLRNVDEMDELTVVVTMRGECTFGEKALVAYDYGLVGILFVNNEEGLFHPSGPEARDIQLGTFMITQHDGNHLIQALRTVAHTTGPEHSLNGRFVPIICRDSNSNSYCSPKYFDDERFEAAVDYSGKIYTNHRDGGNEHGVFDYIQGEFGSWLDPISKWNTMVPSVIGGDAHCCDRAGFEGNEVANTTAILCLRGECDFLTKAENVEATGAKLMTVSSYNNLETVPEGTSYNNTIIRMGANPPYRGRKVMVTTVMVSSDAYEAMVSDFFTQLDEGRTSTIRMSQPGDACKSLVLN